MKILSDYSHTVAGVFYFDLPVGLILTFLFHNVIRDTFVDNAPYPVKQRIAHLRYFNWNLYFKHNWLVVVISIIIGAFSHLLWDGFTHEIGFFVQNFSAMQATYTIFGNTFAFYRILQHVSTVTGLLILGYAFYRLPLNRYVSSYTDNGYWTSVFSITLVITAIRTSIHSDNFSHTQIIVTLISAGIIGLSITPSLLKLFRQRSMA